MKKQRFWLVKRGGVFYLQDSQTGTKESLATRDRKEAERLRLARNEAAEKPVLGLALAKAYVSAYDPKLPERSWQMVMDEFTRRGKDSSRIRRDRAMRSATFAALRKRKLLETTPDDLRAILADGVYSTNHFLRCWHNLAIGLGWLPWPIIPPKLWPDTSPRPKRGITADEHRLIVEREGNEEKRRFYELLWETGAAQSDGATLSADNIDWDTRVLSYVRHKTGEWARLAIGERLEKLLRELPTHGPLFPHLSTLSPQERSSEFWRRCRTLKLRGVSLHSYRYAWAERAKRCGYPERFAQEALGHTSKAVHRAYARKAEVTIPSMEDYERAQPSGKVVRVAFNPVKVDRPHSITTPAESSGSVPAET